MSAPGSKRTSARLRIALALAALIALATIGLVVADRVTRPAREAHALDEARHAAFAIKQELDEHEMPLIQLDLKIQHGEADISALAALSSLPNLVDAAFVDLKKVGTKDAIVWAQHTDGILAVTCSGRPTPLEDEDVHALSQLVGARRQKNMWLASYAFPNEEPHPRGFVKDGVAHGYLFVMSVVGTDEPAILLILDRPTPVEPVLAHLRRTLLGH